MRNGSTLKASFTHSSHNGNIFLDIPNHPRKRQDPAFSTFRCLSTSRKGVNKTILFAKQYSSAQNDIRHSYIEKLESAIYVKSPDAVLSSIPAILTVIDGMPSVLINQALNAVEQAFMFLLVENHARRAFECFRLLTSSPKLNGLFPSYSAKVRLFQSMAESPLFSAEELHNVGADLLHQSVAGFRKFTTVDTAAMPKFLSKVIHVTIKDRFEDRINIIFLEQLLLRLENQDQLKHLTDRDWANLSCLRAFTAYNKSVGLQLQASLKTFKLMEVNVSEVRPAFFARIFDIALSRSKFQLVREHIQLMRKHNVNLSANAVRGFVRHSLKSPLPIQVSHEILELASQQVMPSEELIAVSLELAVKSNSVRWTKCLTKKMIAEGMKITTAQLTRALQVLVGNCHFSEVVGILQDADASALDTVLIRSLLRRVIVVATASQFNDFLNVLRARNIVLCIEDLEWLGITLTSLLRSHTGPFVAETERRERLAICLTILEAILSSSLTWNPDRRLYAPILVELAKSGENEKLKNVLDLLQERGEPQSTYTSNLLVQAEVRQLAKTARKDSIPLSTFRPLLLLRELGGTNGSTQSSSQPDIWAWNEVIAAVAKFGSSYNKFQSLLGLLAEMQSIGITPDLATLTGILPACSIAGNVIHLQKLCKQYCDPRDLDFVWYNGILTCYKNLGLLTNCEKLLQYMVSASQKYLFNSDKVLFNADSVNILMEAFANSDNPDRTFDWFKWGFHGNVSTTLPVSGPPPKHLQPNHRTLNALIMASIASPRIVDKVHLAKIWIRELDLKPDVATENLLLWASLSSSTTDCVDQVAEARRNALARGEAVFFDMVNMHSMPRKEAFVSLINAAGRVAVSDLNELLQEHCSDSFDVIPIEIVQKVSSGLAMQKAVSWVNEYERVICTNLYVKDDGPNVSMAPYLALINAFASIGDVDGVKAWRARVMQYKPSLSDSDKMTRFLVKALVTRRDWRMAEETIESLLQRKVSSGRPYDVSLWHTYATGKLSSAKLLHDFGKQSEDRNTVISIARVEALEALCKIPAQQIDMKTVAIALKACSWRSDPWLDEALLLHQWVLEGKARVDLINNTGADIHDVRRYAGETVGRFISRSPSALIERKLNQSAGSLLIDTFTFTFQKANGHRCRTETTSLEHQLCEVWQQLCDQASTSASGPDLNIWNSLLEAICSGLRRFEDGLLILSRMGSHEGFNAQLTSTSSGYIWQQSPLSPLLLAISKMNCTPNASYKTILSVLKPLLEFQATPNRFDLIETCRQLVESRWPEYVDGVNRVIAMRK
jgi:hypothetical protein